MLPLFHYNRAKLCFFIKGLYIDITSANNVLPVEYGLKARPIPRLP